MLIRKKTKIIKCLYCKKEFTVLKYSIQRFCCSLCRTKYKLYNHNGSKQLQYLVDNLDYILQELKYKSIRKIAVDLNISHSYLAGFVKNYHKYITQPTQGNTITNIDSNNVIFPRDIIVNQ